MKVALVFLSLVLLSVIGIVPPAAAAGPVSMNMTVVTGGGELEGGSSLGTQFVSLALTNPGHPVTVDRGNLVVGGARQKCTAISNVTDCTSATLTCSDGDHDVVVGGPGQGSLDGVLLTQGSIRMVCLSR